MNQGPYIGIAGITSREQIDAIVDGHPSDAPPLAMGVLGSYKTLILRRPNKYANRYPKAEDIRGIFSTDHRVRNVLHYSFAEDDMDPPRCAQTLWNELDELRELTWPRDVWLQVNARPMIRPWVAEALARAAVQWTHVIVQVSGAAMREGFTYLDDVLARLAVERDKVTLLFDTSGGTGRPLDLQQAAAFVGYYHDWDWGLAGGFTPENVAALRPIFTAVSERIDGGQRGLSIDVESGVRDIHDRLDIAKAIAFRDAARELYR